MSRMEQRIEVRRAAPADAAVMVQLFHDTIHHVNAADYTPRQLAAWSTEPATAQAWQARQTGLHVWVAEYAGECVGFAELDPTGHIDCFFVSHRHQGMGIGRQLMDTLLAAARQLGMRTVAADVSVTARPFFLRQGFRIERAQQARRRGVAFRQFRMSRALP